MFNIETFYNYSKKATSTEGYKHNSLSLEKMKKDLKDKSNYFMLGKKHTKQSLQLISKAGKLNPMFNKKYSDATKL